MYSDIVAALEHCRDAAHGFIEAVDELVEQGRDVNADELAQIDKHWARVRAAREEYERALEGAGHDRPDI